MFELILIIFRKLYETSNEYMELLINNLLLKKSLNNFIKFHLHQFM